MKYSKTKSLEKVQYFPPEKQAPWVPSSGRGNRSPVAPSLHAQHSQANWRLGRWRQWVLCPKTLFQNEPVVTPEQCILLTPLPHGKLLHALGSYLISPDLNFLTHKRLWRFNEMTKVTHLKEFLVHSKCPINVSYDYCYYYHYEYRPCFPLSGYHVKPTGCYQKTSSPSVPDINRFSSSQRTGPGLIDVASAVGHGHIHAQQHLPTNSYCSYYYCSARSVTLTHGYLFPFIILFKACYLTLCENTT